MLDLAGVLFRSLRRYPNGEQRFHQNSVFFIHRFRSRFAENGQSLNTRWNIEYVKYAANRAGEYRLEEFSIDRPTFKSLTGISVIDYNDQLLLFGGVDENMTYLGRDIFISENEGLSWIAADTAKNQLPETYSARQKQSAIVRDNYIYVFGGQDGQQTYSDVYRGRLNSIDW